MLTAGVLVVYIDTGNPVLYISSKSRDLADDNSKFLTEWIISIPSILSIKLFYLYQRLQWRDTYFFEIKFFFFLVMCIGHCLHDGQTQYGCFESCQFRPRSVFFVSWRLKCSTDDFRCIRYYCDNVMWILGTLRFKSIHLLFYTFIHMYISNDSNVILKYFHFVLLVVFF
jgi:hypothetical protein